MKELFGIETFRNPEALVLLALIPIYLFWFVRYYKKQRLLIRLSYDPSKLLKSGPKLSFLRYLPRFFQLLAVAFMILAVARPQTVDKIPERRSKGMEIMVLMDVSSSMEYDDFRPSRLSEAKRVVNSFSQSRTQDKIGLILFAATALNYVPLTQDHNFLMRMVKDVGFDFLPKHGTAIGPAMLMAVNRMREDPDVSKMIVLLTDGANNRGEADPIAAARIAKRFNIKTYCIGIGTQIESDEEEKNIAALDEEILKEISSITGGEYYPAYNSLELDNAFAKIAALENAEIPTINLREVKDYYPIFVQIAILALALSYVLMLTFIYNPLEQ